MLTAFYRQKCINEILYIHICLYFSRAEYSHWCSECPTSHLAGGIKSTNTSLEIPRDGRYFVYCQFHFLQTDNDRTGFEILINGNIYLSKVVKGEEATYSGAVFVMKKQLAFLMISFIVQFVFSVEDP